MKTIPYAILAILFALSCRPTPNTYPDMNEQTFFAEYSEPCGRAILKISANEGGPFQNVQPVGIDSPTNRLRYHALLTGRFKVRGILTGEQSDDGHCGAYPTLQVNGFEPWGSVKRCTSVGSLNTDLHFFTEDQSNERYAPSDFRDNGAPPTIDMESCVEHTTACVGDLTEIMGCDDVKWCCAIND